MYFPQGHEAYLRTFPENKTPPYKLFKGRPAVVRCQVRVLWRCVQEMRGVWCVEWVGGRGRVRLFGGAPWLRGLGLFFGVANV